MTPSRFAFLAVACALATQPVVAADPRGDSFDARMLSAEESRTLFHLPPGFEIQLVAAEPAIQKPFNLAFDAAGRVWVTGSTLYPWPARRDALGEPIATFQKNWDDNPVAFRAAAAPPPPVENGADTIRVLSDFDPATGRARKIETFADGLNIPIGIVPLPRGVAGLAEPGPGSATPATTAAPGPRGDTVLVFSIPAIWRLTDTDGDGKADKREKLYDGFAFKDTHGMSSNYWLWLDGWVYGTHGFNNASEVVDRAGRVTKITSGNTYRFRPDGSRFEVFANGQTNPFGLAFDARGDVFTADSHSKPVYLLVPGGYYEGLSKEHDGLGFAPPITLDDHGSSAIAGIAHYSATQFPAEYRGNLFNGNPVTRRVNRDRLDWRGSSPSAARQPDFLSSDDPSFRPVQVKLGPDGALWIADFYNPIIGHYESPLTHPARDRSHGRIWRIVWRGRNAASPAPSNSLPNLAALDPAGLVARLADPNLVVRSLALAELLARADAATAAPALQAAGEKLIAGTDPAADETAALPLFLALERLGRADDALLRRALTRPGSDVALAALRALATREKLPADAEAIFSAIAGQRPEPNPFAATPGLAWRVMADLLRRDPPPWGGPLLLAMLAKTPEADFELNYALRLALKTQALGVDAATLRAWSAADNNTAGALAEVCLAVKTPAAAEFLLWHLEQTKFAGVRAGDFARHAVEQLPADRFDAVRPLQRSLATAPLTQRIALAEGLAGVAAKPDRKLPGDVETWMRHELVAAIGNSDLGPAYRAINAVKPLAIWEKAEPLRLVALNASYNDGTRNAALRALTAGAKGTEETLMAVLASPASLTVRRVAADLLGTEQATPAARAALIAAFATAHADIAMVVATGLARSDAGAAELIALAAAGRVTPTLLRQRYVAAALEKRPAELRARAEALTRDLPPEDARIDAVIAQRIAAAPKYKPEAARGAPLFAANCATCHRFHNQGGNLGPSLDGIGARTTSRLVEDILDPSRNVDPAFRLAIVTLKNGETKSGINLREESGHLLLTDPVTALPTVIAKADVAGTAASPASPMPPAFETALTEAEFFDLLEYLRTPAK